MGLIRIPFDEAKLKRQVRAHLRAAGFTRDDDGRLQPPSLDKAAYRALHLPQRMARLRKELPFVKKVWPQLSRYFAEGADIDVKRIRVRLELISGSTWQSELFRLACLLWSVPVSQGFGRRLRFLVWDDSNGKLMGLFALGDPVFNLKARDEEIGWTGKDRGKRLVDTLDAYVLGAVPPYNKLLGGKLVASLVRTQEVVNAFRARYNKTRGIISRKAKKAQLVAVTTTSSLGRSSLYNRLKLDGQLYFKEIGFTTGYGHFHFPDSLFESMREFLRSKKDAYAGNHGYGQGPNWRLRTIRRALELIGLDPKLLKHGLRREVFICTLADNAKLVLKGERKRAQYKSLRTAEEVMSLALVRWIQPRAARDQSYRLVTRQDVWRSIAGTEAPQPTSGAELRADRN